LCRSPSRLQGRQEIVEMFDRILTGGDRAFKTHAAGNVSNDRQTFPPRSCDDRGVSFAGKKAVYLDRDIAVTLVCCNRGLCFREGLYNPRAEPKLGIAIGDRPG